MQSSDEFIARFMWDLDARRGCEKKDLVSDALPPQARVMSILRAEICPSEICDDVDRAIIGASLGG